jgi:acetyl esterase/lipase
MDANPSAMLKLLVPKIPFIFKTALLHSLWLSPTSSKWNLRTELIIHIFRNMAARPTKPSSISKLQYQTCKDSGVKGEMWISRVTASVPLEDDLRQLLFKTIDQMKQGGEEYTQPPLLPVEAEWTGYRANVAKSEPEPSISEEEKYVSLMKEVTSDVTVLYFHGGAYYLCDPATHRPVTSKVAKLTGGRVYSVRYRLAPQSPFPAQLLDGLVAYMNLLYPPEDAFHTAVPPEKIVFGGDSAGGNLSMALLQLLLQRHRNSAPGHLPTVTWNNKTCTLPLPAGVAVNSPWLDVTRSLPSIEGNVKYDYLPPPSITEKSTPPRDSIWPTDPPRVDVFCEGSALCHPLVSPLAAMSWEKSPPIFIVSGDETLADEASVFAQRVAKQGVKVVWDRFEAMPHCFAMVLEGLEGSRMCFTDYTDFIKRVVQNPESIKTEGYLIYAKTLAKKHVDVEKLINISDEQALEMMRTAQKRRIAGMERAGKALPML